MKSSGSEQSEVHTPKRCFRNILKDSARSRNQSETSRLHGDHFTNPLIRYQLFYAYAVVRWQNDRQVNQRSRFDPEARGSSSPRKHSIGVSYACFASSYTYCQVFLCSKYPVLLPTATHQNDQLQCASKFSRWLYWMLGEFSWLWVHSLSIAIILLIYLRCPPHNVRYSSHKLRNIRASVLMLVWVPRLEQPLSMATLKRITHEQGTRLCSLLPKASSFNLLPNFFNI